MSSELIAVDVQRVNPLGKVLFPVVPLHTAQHLLHVELHQDGAQPPLLRVAVKPSFKLGLGKLTPVGEQI